MSEAAHFTAEEARAAGEQIGIDWATSRFEVEQFRMGMDVELEHGTHDLETNVTDDDVVVTAKIARAHLNEFPDYYSRLAVMEAEAEATGKRRASSAWRRHASSARPGFRTGEKQMPRGAGPAVTTRLLWNELGRLARVERRGLESGEFVRTRKCCAGFGGLSRRPD